MIDELKTWLGTPYFFRGKMKGTGVDCLQFTFIIFDLVGVRYSKPTSYERTPKGSEFFAWIKQHTNLTQKETLTITPGDFVVVNLLKDRPFHMIYCMDKDFCIHASVRHGVCLIPVSQVTNINSIWRLL
jgi:cell wall-associated NlpC family hydrolase